MAPNDGSRDVQAAVAALAERLPSRLQPLARIVYNYRWAWSPDCVALFREIEPGLWWQSECNPRHVIEHTPPRRLRALADDSAFVGRVEGMAAALASDLARPSPQGPIDPSRPVAYFCSEFAIHSSLPLYGGGLGVLAGDFLKTASDLALPTVGVGLLYLLGYFRQRLDTNGWQHEYWTPTNFNLLPVVRVTGADGSPLSVEVQLRHRKVVVRVWRIEVGRVPLYLLDSSSHDNHVIDRWITSRLYIGDRQTRLAQYAVLGIAGMRALAAMGIEPGIVHMNEGHAAFSSFERLRELIVAGCTFDQALERVRARSVFTTHTPVPAGNEGYREDEVEVVLSDFVDTLGIPRATFYDLGRLHPGDRSEPANITPLALRTSGASNGVSRRHGVVARTMWQTLWPGLPVDEVPIAAVTNGVHLHSWMSPPVQNLLARHLGPDWTTRIASPEFAELIAGIPDAEVWDVRCTLRRALIEFARERSVCDRLARGEAPEYVEQANVMMAPDALTVGFARRVATYKRLHLLIRHLDRALPLLEGPRPMQLVLAGKAHPQDQEAKETLGRIFQVKRAGTVGGRVVFLEDYDLRIAPGIVAGVDLWLNLPRRPQEASGTSGMKVAMNGGLNLSVLDGWWEEGYDGTNGWAIDSPEGSPDWQDDHDAAALLDLIERDVLPLFYRRGDDAVPHGWVARIKHAMATLIPRFTAERMVREYIQRIYDPGVRSGKLAKE